MFSDKEWNALVKATRHLKEHIGKEIVIKDKGKCKVVNYTLSTQIILQDKNGDKFSMWYDEIKGLLNE